MPSTLVLRLALVASLVAGVGGVACSSPSATELGKTAGAEEEPLYTAVRDIANVDGRTAGALEPCARLADDINAAVGAEVKAPNGPPAPFECPKVTLYNVMEDPSSGVVSKKWVDLALERIASDEGLNLRDVPRGASCEGAGSRYTLEDAVNLYFTTAPEVEAAVQKQPALKTRAQAFVVGLVRALDLDWGNEALAGSEPPPGTYFSVTQSCNAYSSRPARPDRRPMAVWAMGRTKQVGAVAVISLPRPIRSAAH